MGVDVATPDGPQGPEVRVMAARCDTCIFRPGNLMNLAPGRVAQMVGDAVSCGGHITCHQTLDPGQLGAICHGYARKHGHHSNAIQLGYALGALRHIDPANYRKDKDHE